MKINKWKYGFGAFLIGIVLTVRTIPVYAAEDNSSDSSPEVEIIEEEKKVERVPVVFQIGCMDGFKENLTVQIYDADTLKKVLEVILTSADGYTVEGKTLEPDKMYAITVDCKNKEEWTINNADGSAIGKYEVGDNPLKLSWQVERKKEKKSSSDISTEKTEVADPKSATEDMGEMTKEYGQKLIETFMEEYSYLETDSTFQTTRNRYTTEKCKKDFLSCANNRDADANAYTEKKWDSCSDFEKTMYTLLFVRPYNILMGANSADHANTKDDFVAYISLFAGLDAEADYTEKIMDIWRWQYDYYKVTGRVEDSFQDLDTSKNVSDKPEKDRVEKDTGKVHKGEDGIEKSQKSLNQDSEKTAVERRRELGGKENYLSILRKNALSLLLVMIFGGIVLSIYLKKRKQKSKEK